MTITTSDQTHKLSRGTDRTAAWRVSNEVPVRLALKSIWAVADQALFALSNFVLSLLLARWLSPQGYGAFGVAFSIFLFLGVLHAAFFTEPMLVHGASDQYRHEFGGYLQVLLKAHLRFSVIATMALLTVALGLVLLDLPALSRSLIGLAFMSPLALFLLLTRRACYALLVPRLAASGGAVYMIIMMSGMAILNGREWLSPETAFGVMGIGSLVSGAWLLDRVLANSGSHEHVSGLRILQAHLQYGRWAAPSSILSWATGSTPFLLLPLWGGLEAVGALKALMNLLMPVLHAIGALSVLLVPGLVRRRQTDDFGRFAKLALALFLVGGTIYSILLMLFAGPLLNWMYDGKYDAVARWLPLLALLLVPSSVSAAFGAALRAADRPDLVFRAYAGSAVTALLMAVPLLRNGGLGGAVLLTLITSVVTASILLLAGYREITCWHGRS